MSYYDDMMFLDPPLITGSGASVQCPYCDTGFPYGPNQPWEPTRQLLLAHFKTRHIGLPPRRRRAFRYLNVEKLIAWARETDLGLVPWQEDMLRRMEQHEVNQEFLRIMTADHDGDRSKDDQSE